MVLRPEPVVHNWKVSGFFPQADADMVNWNRWNRGAVGLVELVQNDTTPRQTFFFNNTGGVLVRRVTFHAGVACTEQRSTLNGFNQDGLNALNIMPITDVSGLAAGFRNPSWQRVARFKWRMASTPDPGDPTSVLDDATGLLMIPWGAPQSVQTWPTAAANNGGFGVTGSGVAASPWQWAVYATGAFPGNIVETVSLGAMDREEWHTFELVVTTGAPGREALVELLVDGLAVLNRGFQGLAPLIPELGAAEFAWRPSFRYGGPDEVSLFLGDWSYSAGRFLPGGLEVLT